MTSMNISLPEPMRAFVEEQVVSGSYGTASEYFRELVRNDQKRKEEERVKTLLLEGLQSEAREVTDADWAELKRRAEARLAKVGQ